MAKKKKKVCYSGIGGEAVLEGVMMRNKEDYAVAVRKPDGNIEVQVDKYPGVLHGRKWKELPFIRGIFSFIDSMILGTRALNYSATFYDEEEEADDGKEPGAGKISKETVDKIVNVFVTVLALVLAVGIFIVLPYFISYLLDDYIRNESILLIVEGLIRIGIFLLYVWGISLMKDIRRMYQYHGAEHKCINCIERGRPLTVKNVKSSSRLHKRCGTSFMFFVLIVGIVLSFFIRTESVFLRIFFRILILPIVAGISYELIRLAGRYDNIFVKILSAPGFGIQKITTREPDESMIEVGIASVEAVFDWRMYLHDNFGYDLDDLWEMTQDEAENE